MIRLNEFKQNIMRIHHLEDMEFKVCIQFFKSGHNIKVEETDKCKQCEMEKVEEQKRLERHYKRNSLTSRFIRSISPKRGESEEFETTELNDITCLHLKSESIKEFLQYY